MICTAFFPFFLSLSSPRDIKPRFAQNACNACHAAHPSVLSCWKTPVHPYATYRVMVVLVYGRESGDRVPAPSLLPLQVGPNEGTSHPASNAVVHSAASLPLSYFFSSSVSLPVASFPRFATQLSMIFPTSLKATGFVMKRSIPHLTASV